MCVFEGVTSSLLIIAFKNRFILAQLLRPMLPDESMTNPISAMGLHSLSGKRLNGEIHRIQTPNLNVFLKENVENKLAIPIGSILLS